VKTGLPRQEAYVFVQQSALAVVNAMNSGAAISADAFREALAQNANVTSRLDAKTLDELFDLDHHLRHAPHILERALGAP
jgi:adenylosuccinate lyase